MAAVKIQSAVRSFLQKRRAKRQNRAAVVIQSIWRGYLARNRLRLKKEAELRALQHQAATIIQVGVRNERLSFWAYSGVDDGTLSASLLHHESCL